MTTERLQEITSRYPGLRIALVGDFCLDRYLEIDPARQEISIETGLPVHNVVNVRAQPGGAGTVLSNLVALGVGTIIPVGFHGDDGEGYELRRAMGKMPGVRLDHFFQSPDRRTFTYCKPLLISPGSDLMELSRLDSKNWTPTPSGLRDQIVAAIHALATSVDAVIVLEQVDEPDTGVCTPEVREALKQFGPIPVIADSRRGLRDFSSVIFKMNGTEFRNMCALDDAVTLEALIAGVTDLAVRNSAPAFVTLAERGIIGAMPDGTAHHSPSMPLRGAIDIVGAGDSVTANLAAALAAGASLPETLYLAMLASSIVIHKLGTTGTASAAEIAALNA